MTGGGRFLGPLTNLIPAPCISGRQALAESWGHGGVQTQGQSCTEKVGHLRVRGEGGGGAGR